MAEVATLYVCHGDDQGPRMHPCRRVQEALRDADIPYAKVIAAQGSPIPFLRKGSREELRWATGTDKLPTLKLTDGTVISNSRAILGWVNEQNTTVPDREGGKGFGNHPATRRAIAVPVILVALAIVAAAERDIHRRKDSEIQGNKTIWRLLSLNAVGALAYFRRGRA